MAQSNWQRSNRQMPPGWDAIRAKVKRRAKGQCQCTGCLLHPDTCTSPGSDCDHIEGRDNHSLSNLQWLCHQCHAVKTAQQARDAIQAQRSKLTHPSTRTKHPGIL